MSGPLLAILKNAPPKAVYPGGNTGNYVKRKKETNVDMKNYLDKRVWIDESFLFEGFSLMSSSSSSFSGMGKRTTGTLPGCNTKVQNATSKVQGLFHSSCHRIFERIREMVKKKRKKKKKRVKESQRKAGVKTSRMKLQLSPCQVLSCSEIQISSPIVVHLMIYPEALACRPEFKRLNIS